MIKHVLYFFYFFCIFFKVRNNIYNKNFTNKMLELEKLRLKSPKYNFKNMQRHMCVLEVKFIKS